MENQIELSFAMEGILAELEYWFQKGTEEQRELLITSLRNCSDLIDEDMPSVDF
jgi:hypothetical protein